MRSLLLLLPAACLVASLASAGSAAPKSPPPGPGLDIIKARCVGCHAITQVFNAPPKTTRNWAQTVRKMAQRNTAMTKDEIKVVNAYMAQHYATDRAVAAVAAKN
jgi:hypothetical protein